LNVWFPPGGHQCLPLNTVLSQVHERVVKNVHTGQILVSAIPQALKWVLEENAFFEDYAEV